MAFLCPVRIRRGKKTKDGDKMDLRTANIGRITGSASIETLVRVGIEKENGLAPDSKMVVLHDFNPCVDDELEVKRGQIVNVLYQENDWVYVIAENNQEGFIPSSYCASIGSKLAELAFNVKLKKPRSGDSESVIQLETEPYSNSCNEVHPFHKDPSGQYVVLYTFTARDENDVNVERGESVTVLNKEDPDWYWIIRSDGQEGFVPSAFVSPVDSIDNTQNNSNLKLNLITSNANQVNSNATSSLGVFSEQDERIHGTELVMLYDYKAQAPDDLSVSRGDWIYANLTNQAVDGWLWAYAPKIRKYGFIPKAYARPPAMTSL